MFEGGDVQRPSRIWAAGCFVLASSLFLLVLIGFPGTPDRGVGAWLTRGAAGLSLVLLLWSYTYFTRSRRLMRSHREGKLFELPPSQPEQLQQSAQRNIAVDQCQAFIFATAIIFPTRLRQRMVEQYDPKARTLLQTVALDIKIPPRYMRSLLLNAQHLGTPITILMPVALPRKGELLDDLVVTDASDALLPVLPYQEYLQLAASILRTLLVGAYGGELDDEALGAERLALADILRRGASREDSVSEGAAALSQLVVKNEDVLAFAVRIVEELSKRYAIVVSTPVDPQGRATVVYRQTITPTLDLNGDGRSAGIIARVKATLRILLGCRPIGVHIPLDDAWTSQSYHLKVNSEDGLYLAAQDAPELEGYLDDCWSSIQDQYALSQVPAPPHYRFRSRLGQPHAHFYCRFFPEPPGYQDDINVPRSSAPAITLQFVETPPGSAFRALVASIAAAAAICAVAVVVSKAGARSDTPIVLLALPGLLAAWLGFQHPTRRLLEGTLTARVSLGATFLLSLASCMLFMADREAVKLAFDPTFQSIAVFGVHRGSWAVLMMMSCLSAGYMVFAYSWLSYEYLHLSSRENRWSKHRVG